MRMNECIISDVLVCSNVPFQNYSTFFLLYIGLFNKAISTAKVIKRLITEVRAQRIDDLDEMVVASSKILFQRLRKNENFKEDRVSKK